MNCHSGKEGYNGEFVFCGDGQDVVAAVTLERQVWTPLAITDQMRKQEERAGRDIKYCLES